MLLKSLCCLWLRPWVYTCLATLVVVQSSSAFAQSTSPHSFSHIANSETVWRLIGTAKIDVTPTHAVLLNGYSGRKHERTVGMPGSLWARAIAIGADDASPAVLIAVDNLGIPARVHRGVAAILERKHRILRSNLTINASHTHSAPMLTDVANNIPTRDLSIDEFTAMDRYTDQLVDLFVQVAEQALAKRVLCRLDWGQAKATFAINRRGSKVVDHSLPILRITDQAGTVRAVITNYACHTVTVPGDHQMSGDWSGYAAAELEGTFPGSVAVILAGCGADQNPEKVGSVEEAKRQGHLLASSMLSIRGETLTPVTAPLDVKFQEVELPLATAFTKEDWQKRAAEAGIIGYHARKNLARLERGELISTSITYPVQTWSFGNQLAAVFLAGEVVVDYSKLIKAKYGDDRIWVSGYSNDAPCYIPSDRILREGGYEGGDAMVWYDKPRPFAPGLEQIILDEVDRQIAHFQLAKRTGKTGGTQALSPHQSLAQIQVPDDLRVEIVASEPLVIDPVAIDFGHDGKLWVAEMRDYPEGIDGKFAPGGRITYLVDTDHDGHYDKTTTFLDNVAFPTGIKVWRNGVLICAAPDVIYAEDTDGDGKADIVRQALTGFSTDNQQARVNSLSLGLDNWVYGAAGVFGGEIHAPGKPAINSNHRDFRFQPDTGLVEAVSGRTQQGRARDDWGNWFGCDSGILIYHFPLQEHYFARNSNTAAPNSSIAIADNQQLFPSGKLVQFALSGPPGVPTSACGLTIYRDDLLGEEYRSNAFVCEPVNQLVHRMTVEPKGTTFAARRAPGDTNREFLASTDNWFRPVQAVTGPDGALYIVDLYRYLIEHPRWLTHDAQEQVDSRAGDRQGRIFRIVPKNKPLRRVPQFASLSTPEVAGLLDSANGAVRDMAHLQLLWRNDPSVVESLLQVARSAMRPEVRLQAMSAADGLGPIAPDSILAGLNDPHPAIRRRSIQLAEKPAVQTADVITRLWEMADDTDPQVRLQLGYSIGQISDRRAGAILLKLLRTSGNDRYLISACLTSLTRANVSGAVTALFEARDQITDEIANRYGIELLTTAAAIGDDQTRRTTAEYLLKRNAHEKYAGWQFTTVCKLIPELARHKTSLPDDLAAQFTDILNAARDIVDSVDSEEQLCASAIELLQHGTGHNDRTRLANRLSPQQSPAIQHSAIRSLAAMESTKANQILLDRFGVLAPDLQKSVLDEVLKREQLADALLSRIETDSIARGTIDPTRRLALANHPQPTIRSRSAKLFAAASGDEIKSQIDRFSTVNIERGNPIVGRAIFQKYCAGCHRVDGLGHVIGPDLAALTDKTATTIVTAIVDPNRNVDQRYAAYTALTQSGQVFTGIMVSESLGSFVLKANEGKEQTILRKDLDGADSLRNTGKSFMPEGLARELDLRAMQNLLAFLAQASASPTGDQFQSVKGILELMAGVQSGSKEERQKIPTAWEISLAAGRRNSQREILALLDLCMPHDDEPLAIWQAVVLGGGLINGLSQVEIWPDERIHEILKAHPRLIARWNRSLDQAVPMADNTDIDPGFRYDAIRMTALRPFTDSRTQLLRYVEQDNHRDLRQGAISGLSDVKDTVAVTALLAACKDADSELRDLAVRGVLRTDEGAKRLLSEIDSGRLGNSIIHDELRTKLVKNDNPEIRVIANRVFNNR